MELMNQYDLILEVTITYTSQPCLQLAEKVTNHLFIAIILKQTRRQMLSRSFWRSKNRKKRRGQFQKPPMNKIKSQFKKSKRTVFNQMKKNCKTFNKKLMKEMKTSELKKVKKLKKKSINNKSKKISPVIIKKSIQNRSK